MRTDDLIRSLAEDTHRGPALGRMVWLAWAGAAMLAVVTFLLLLGPRQISRTAGRPCASCSSRWSRSLWR